MNMAVRGVGYFDSKGHFYRTPDEATLSDLAALLGRMGDGDSLAPGIAKILFEKRREIEHLFHEHDLMVQGGPVETPMPRAMSSDVSNIKTFGAPRVVS